MPNLELSSFIETELASNPLLELAEDRELRSPEAPERPKQSPKVEAATGASKPAIGLGNRLRWTPPVWPPTSARKSRTPSSRIALTRLRRPTACGEYLGGGQGRS